MRGALIPQVLSAWSVALDVTFNQLVLMSNEAQMAKVDIQDKTIRRFVISRHKFDPETSHFRWVPEIAFDQKRDWDRYWDWSVKELKQRERLGSTHFKEEISGYILEINNLKNHIDEKHAGHKSLSLLSNFFRRKNYLPGYETGYAEYKTFKNQY